MNENTNKFSLVKCLNFLRKNFSRQAALPSMAWVQFEVDKEELTIPEEELAPKEQPQLK